MIETDRLVLPHLPPSPGGLSVAVPSRRYACLMGKSGCGKTSLLEAIAGLRPARSGTVKLHGRDVTTEPPQTRDLGYVPQDGALFPTLTVRQHLAFALELRQVARVEVNRRVNELADWLEIAPLLDRSALTLSGGEARRTALGRALSFRPTVLLLDEPLTGLDDATRDAMVALLRRLRDARDTTVLHVTHSAEEAARLADLTFVMRAGHVSAVRPEDAPVSATSPAQ
ncbi:MAG: ABC transporter ATP-binding protein [Planctomycetota bacterium]